tara:strand:- start:304 stop:1119 length:816 start_codon:yes stop_codon:yes gene_type:complete
LKNSDFILDWTDKLKSEMNEIPFVEDDIRKDFFGMLTDTAYCYYRSYLLYEISDLINSGKLDFGEFKDNIHVKAIEALSKNSKSNQSHFNSLNRNFIIDAWSTFEICVNTFCKEICNENEIEHLLNWKFRDVKKVLPKEKLNDNELEKLSSKLGAGHLTHVPIVRKTDIIFKKVNGYSRDIEEDKKFLLFFGRFRNTMHSNFIYYGKSFDYKFGHALFKFEDGDMVKWYDPFESTPKLYFYLVGNLKNIWKAMIEAIKFDGMIYYPNLEQE